MKINRSVLLFLCLLFSISNFDSQVRAAVITWTNTSGGVWSVPSNWSPNQEPGSNDTVLITTPGTYTVALDQTNFAQALTVGGDEGSGTQLLLVTNMLSVGSDTIVQGGGVIETTNGTSSFLSKGFVTVMDGGTLTVNAGYLNFFFTTTSLIVTNGGIINAIGYPTTFDSFLGISFPAATFNGPVLVANGGTLNASHGTGALFSVGPGGILNVTSELFTALGTNQGTINITNADFAVGNFQTQPAVAGLVNLPGGVINLTGTNYINGGNYFTNQGSIVQYSGVSSIYSGDFEPSTGTVTNLGGSLTFQYIETNLTGDYYCAPGATNFFEGVDRENSQSTNQITIGSPLTLRGLGEFQLSSGYLYLPSTVPTNLELACDTITLGPDFQGGTITNFTVSGTDGFSTYLENVLPITGTFTLSNAACTQPILVKKGAVFNFYQAFDPYDNQFKDLVVQPGGTMNVYGGEITDLDFGIIATSWTNYGAINFQNSQQLQIFGGLINEPNGTINLNGACSIVLSTSSAYLTNLGTIVQNSPANVTNVVSYLLNPNTSENFDSSHGTITNLSGTLILESIASNTISGVYYTATGASIQFVSSTNAAMTVSSSLALAGRGQFEFASGSLYLANTIPPNLLLLGGTIELGPDFQGGAITNLSLNGAAITNSSGEPMLVTGLLCLTNVGGVNSEGYFTGTPLYGSFIVTNHGMILASNSTIYGQLSQTNGGTMNLFYSFTYSNVMVGPGCTLNASSWTSSGILSIEPGATLNLADYFSAQFNVYFPGLLQHTNLTNAGTINLTNSSLGINEGPPPNFLNNPPGNLFNLPSGIIHIWGPAAIEGQTGSVLNEGLIISTSPTPSGIEIPFGTNSGTIKAENGSFALIGNWTLTPSSVLSVVLDSDTEYGSFLFTTNEMSLTTGGTAQLAGSFTATLANGFTPATGTSFNVVSYAAETGSFATVMPPAEGKWDETYAATNLVLTLESGGAAAFNSAVQSGANIVFAGAGGAPAGTYEILTSTNLDLPLSKWSVLNTNTYSADGTFSETNAIKSAAASRFYIFKNLP